MATLTTESKNTIADTVEVDFVFSDGADFVFSDATDYVFVDEGSGLTAETKN